MSHAVQFYFERNRDLLFDFFGGVAGPLRDDLRVGVGNVGVGFDRQIVKRNDAPDEKHSARLSTRMRIAQGKIDQPRII